MMNGGVGDTTATTAPTSGLPSSTYAHAFVRGPPRESFQRVQNRLHKAKVLTDELADYFAARRELESSYLKSLQKIAKRSFLSDPSALGPNFLPVYERLIGEIGELASIHGELEKKLEVECEVPMRSASNKGEWGRIKEHDDGLSSTLKEITTLEGQLAKDQKKIDGASSKKASQAAQKAAETERSLKQTMELWETEAPFAFEAYQRVDTQRLDLMREVITKFETARSDAAQRLMASTEQSMQVILNFDPQTDMQEFALRSGTARGGSASAPSHALPSPAPVPATPTAGVNRKNSMGASTFLGRGSNTGQTNGVNEFGGVGQSSSASIHSGDRSMAAAGTSEQGTPSRSSGGGGGGSTLKSALTRFGRGRSNRNTNDTQTVYGSLPEGPESTSMRPPSVRRAEGGERASLDSRSDLGAFSPSSTAGAASSGAPGSLIAPLAPSRTSAAPSLPPPQVDSEGFSIPPPDRKPWEIGEANASPALMDEERETMADLGPAKMTGMSIAQKPITEDAEQDHAALERMRSTLLTARSPALGPQRRNTARRDRRDVRNTTYNPSLALDDGSLHNRGSVFGVGQSGSPIASPSAFNGVPGTGPERTQSIVSSGSMSQMGNYSIDAVSVPAGLNPTIIERVNVVFTGREISKIMVVGEVTVSAKDVLARGPLQLRFESFEQLEKAAPNPAFLKPVEGGSGEAGVYVMDVGAIVNHCSSRGGDGVAKATLLKYQLHLSPRRWADYAPLNVTTQWRCEDHQTSILINYSANPQSQGRPQPPASIQDVSFSVDVTSTGVTNIMSKPNATYSAEQKKLFWKLNEAVNETPNKVLARFQVDQVSQVCPVEVRWRLPGRTLSELDMSIVDVGAQEGVELGPIRRQVTSGKYMASP